MFQKRIPKVMLCCLLIIHMPASGYRGVFHLQPHHHLPSGLHFQDQTSPRTNTLFDDADDLQKQLDNEARDRMKFGRPKTIWVFHFPTYLPEQNSIVETTEGQMRCPRHLRHKMRKKDDESELTPSFRDPSWDYPGQANWAKTFPDCGGRSQSPVSLPVNGHIKPRGARPLLFHNHDVTAQTMSVMFNEKQLILYGEWDYKNRPLVYGGAAHSRRYLFHYMVVHLPAEHTIGNLYYPLETQSFYVSAEYKDIKDAVSDTSDRLAILAISNLFTYGNHTHQGLIDIFDAARNQPMWNASIKVNTLNYFNPPFNEYACYQGSLTTPPCTESVLWLIRGRAMHIERETWSAAQKLIEENSGSKMNLRLPQPLNDRKVYYFK